MHPIIPNPFDSDAVRNPDDRAIIDVPEIHSAGFKACQDAYRSVASTARSTSVLYYGQSGCGKTHLLARFRSWLAGSGDDPPFVSIRTVTAAGYLWRLIRRQYAETLTRRSNDSVLLEQILKAFADRHARGNLQEAIGVQAPSCMTLELERVLLAFHSGRMRDLCRAWLRGDALHHSDREALRLPEPDSDEADEADGEEAARKVVLVFTCIRNR